MRGDAPLDEGLFFLFAQKEPKMRACGELSVDSQGMVRLLQRRFNLLISTLSATL